VNRSRLLDQWKAGARRLKVETYTLFLAYRHPKVPWYAKLGAALVVGYALSPIDLIPDFIPVLGYLDDLILIPLGVMVVMKMIPEPVLAECRQNAELLINQEKSLNWVSVGVIIIWGLLLVFVILMVLRMING
jgi:uncharacterized membrane protein YkvA (DUF1232 family)